MRILYFASLRERVGTGAEELDVPVEVTTVESLIQWLTRRGEPWAGAFAATNRVQCAVNQVMARPDATVSAADEVAFFPRVTGG